MSVDPDIVPHVVLYMGPLLGFLGLGSFLVIKLTLNPGHRRVARQIVQLFWGGLAGVSSAVALWALDVIAFSSLQQIAAMLMGAVIGATVVVVVQHMAAVESQGRALDGREEIGDIRASRGMLGPQAGTLSTPRPPFSHKARFA